MNSINILILCSSSSLTMNPHKFTPLYFWFFYPIYIEILNRNNPNAVNSYYCANQSPILELSIEENVTNMQIGPFREAISLRTRVTDETSLVKLFCHLQSVRVSECRYEDVIENTAIKTCQLSTKLHMQLELKKLDDAPLYRKR